MRSLSPLVALVAAQLLAACGGGGGGGDSSPLPTVSISAAKLTINSGEESTLTWSSTDASSCTASGGWSGTVPSSGTQSTGALTTNTTFSLTCTGAGGTSMAAAVTVNIVPTATLTAEPTAVASGGASTLTWSSTNATGCTATGNWSGALPASGTQSTGALTANSSFSLTCTGPGGTSNAAAATVNIVPTATLTANPTAVAAGGASTLTWSSTDATGCTAIGDWSGSLPASGTQSTGALLKNSSFSLTCSGPSGTSAVATASVSVAVPTATLTANPSAVMPGGASALTWSSTNATSCVASGAWSGPLPVSGNQSTGPLNTSATYTLTCNGLAGLSAVTSATVTVSNILLSPSLAAITLSSTQQYTATVPGGGPVTWTVDGIAGGNATVGLIGLTGLYTAGTAPGAHTIVVTSVANAALSASASVAVTDLAGVYTYHNNLSRDGVNTHEYALTKNTVTTAHFGKLASCAVDGAIYGQPLWVANLTVNSAKHNVVFVATQHDGLFAFDADASPCVKLWSVNLLDSGHGGLGGETSVPASLVGMNAGDIIPEIGVTGTMVIDPVQNIVYVVTKSTNTAQTSFFQRLHAIDLATGNEKTGSPLTIAATYPGTGDGGATVSFNARQELQRIGLALVNGTVYIGWTSHEDTAPWYGWMMSYQYNGTALVQTSILNVAPNAGKAGIWMSGGAPAADAAGNLYVVTGNGGYTANSATAPNNDYGNTLLKLTPSLTVSQYFTPSNEVNNNLNDSDFGSGGATVLADLPAGNTIVHALICGGKDTILFVVNRDLLGGFGDTAAVQTMNFFYSIYATGALWNNQFYLAGAGGFLRAYQLNTATAQFTLASSSSHKYGFGGATPSISSSSATSNGLVWTLETGGNCRKAGSPCGPAVLYAHDAANVTTELWNSSLVAADTAGYAVKFTVPTVANGKVYVGTRGNNAGLDDSSTSTPGELDIYGLKP